MSETPSGLGCPFCDYRGSRESIEAHISAKTDEDHQGKVGRQWRDTIASSVAEVEEDDEPEEDSREAGSFGGLPGPGEDSSEEAGWMLVAATVLFVLVVVATTVDGGDGATVEPAAEDQDGENEDIALVEG